MHFTGIPSDEVPAILATGRSDAEFVFLSLSERDVAGRDAAYLAWHALDHRPEQYRIGGIRNTVRLVSTPACRAARAANAPPFDRVDHIMTYQFASSAAMPEFTVLGAELDKAGRMAHRLPSVGFLTGARNGMIAAPRAVAGADVIPWRPAIGVYVMIELGQTSPEALIDVPGVAGVWWWRGQADKSGMGADSAGKQITYCFLDEDPAACAAALGEAMQARWASGAISGLLAAPFYCLVPYEWDRHLP